MKIVSWVSLDGLERTIKLCSLLVLGVWAVFQYHEKLSIDRKSKSLELIKDFKASPEFATLLRNESEFMPLSEATEMKIAIDVSQKAQTLCPFKKYADNLTTTEQARSERAKLLVGLDQLAICARSNVCEVDELCAFLGRRIQSHLSLFCTYYEDMEIAWQENIRGNVRKFLQLCKTRGYGSGDVAVCSVLAGAMKKRPADLLKECR